MSYQTGRNARGLNLATIAVCALVAIAMGYLGGCAATKKAPTSSIATTETSTTSTRAVSSGYTPSSGSSVSRGGLPYFVEAARVASPAVVHVHVKGVNSRVVQSQLFEYLFGYGHREETPFAKAGSGAIIDPRGYIITNNHVIDEAKEVEVTLPDDRSFTAQVIATDPAIDLAILRINAPENLPSISFGVSDSLQVGEWVLAIGHPFGLGSTVTAGIVSAIPKNVEMQSGLLNQTGFIQVDAAVNPGNSGGPLVDLDGRLVGINTSIVSPTGSFAGYAFSIPQSVAERFAKSVIEGGQKGEVQRVYLGVYLADLNPALAKNLGTNLTEGALITRIRRGYMGERLGLQPYDIIRSINGQNITRGADVQEILSQVKAGDRIELQIVREGQLYTVRSVAR